MEKISIIIPIYKVERYIRECLDSVINQTYENKEVILVDDGSPDSSGVICDEYSSRYPFVRVIHTVNSGPSSARNRGIDEATGEWIIFMDGDDLWADKKCLEKLHSYAKSLKLDIVRFEYQAVNERLEPIELRNYDKSILEGVVIDNFSLVKNAINGEWFTVLFLIKKEIVAEIRFNQGKNFLEDCDFYSRIFASRPLRCGYIDDKMYLYRKISQSISHTADVRKLKASFDLCDLFYSLSHVTVDKNLGQLYCYNSIMMYYWTLQTMASKPYYDKRSEIIEKLSLNELHKRVLARIKEVEISYKYFLFIQPSPKIGVKLLHFKDKIRSLIS